MKTEEIDKYVQDLVNSGYSLEINPLNEDVSTEDFILEDPELVDVERYHIVNLKTGDLLLFLDNSVAFEK